MRSETKLQVFVLIGVATIATASAYSALSDYYAREGRRDQHGSVSKRLSTYSDVMYLLLKRKKLFKPWLLLPNHSQCYQQQCTVDEDCCRGYNICDRSARVCIDCWYGYPCKTNADCCENYPRCVRDPEKPVGGRCAE